LQSLPKRSQIGFPALASSKLKGLIVLIFSYVRLVFSFFAHPKGQDYGNCNNQDNGNFVHGYLFKILNVFEAIINKRNITGGSNPNILKSITVKNKYTIEITKLVVGLSIIVVLLL
jgi:hypothetical protein